MMQELIKTAFDKLGDNKALKWVPCGGDDHVAVVIKNRNDTHIRKSNNNVFGIGHNYIAAYKQINGLWCLSFQCLQERNSIVGFNMTKEYIMEFIINYVSGEDIKLISYTKDLVETVLYDTENEENTPRSLKISDNGLPIDTRHYLYQELTRAKV